MISLGVGELLALLAFPVTAIVARLFENRFIGVFFGTLAGLAMLMFAMTVIVDDAFSEIDLEVPD